MLALKLWVIIKIIVYRLFLVFKKGLLFFIGNYHKLIILTTSNKCNVLTSSSNYVKIIITVWRINMDEVRIIEIKKSIFDDNDKDANRLREELKKKGVFLLNLMSSPGSGKTTTLIRTINALKDKIKIAVMEADIDSDVDAIKIKEATGVQSIQLHTGGMCHLDAEMTRQGLNGLDLNDVDLAILENVGNLVCPAEFDTGASKNCMILSVPEGHDKPLKYPLMFSICDLVLINKIDVAPYFDFDLDKCSQYIKMRNPNAEIIPICAKTGEGVNKFADWIIKNIAKWRNNDNA